MHSNKEKIVLLDFCGTCVPFQSADRFVDFVIENNSNFTTRCRAFLFRLIAKLHLIRRIERWSKNKWTVKKQILYQLKGLNRSVMDKAAEQYFVQIIKPSIIPEIENEIRKRKNEGYRIVIVSGGYDIYLRYFMQYIGGNVNDILATPLIFENDVFTGKMGLDCMGENKITYIQNQFKREDIYSIAYSDSESDFPLFCWSDLGYLVVEKPQWIKNNEIRTISYYRE